MPSTAAHSRTLDPAEGGSCGGVNLGPSALGDGAEIRIGNRVPAWCVHREVAKVGGVLLAEHDACEGALVRVEREPEFQAVLFALEASSAKPAPTEALEGDRRS